MFKAVVWLVIVVRLGASRVACDFFIESAETYQILIHVFVNGSSLHVCNFRDCSIDTVSKAVSMPALAEINLRPVVYVISEKKGELAEQQCLGNRR